MAIYGDEEGVDGRKNSFRVVLEAFYFGDNFSMVWRMAVSRDRWVLYLYDCRFNIGVFFEEDLYSVLAGIYIVYTAIARYGSFLFAEKGYPEVFIFFWMV